MIHPYVQQPEVAVEQIQKDLDRILGLPKRLPVDVDREQITKKWNPEAQGLVNVVTRRFSRGPRLSCGCGDRRIEALSGGMLRVFNAPSRPGEPPPAPIEVAIDAMCRDNAHNPETVSIVSGLRNGNAINLPGLGHPICIKELNPAQAWILWEIPIAGGALGYLGTGSGKTAVSVLAPLALQNCKTAVLLAKPDQRFHYRNNYLRLREHFRVPSIVFDKAELQGSYIVPGTPVLHFVPYTMLSNKKQTDYLERLAPDTIIADEAHCLAAAPSAGRAGSSRTMRFLRYMAKQDNVNFCAWSGSLINKSLHDVSHLAAHALGLGSPYPIDPDEVAAWSAVIDPSWQPDRSSATARVLRVAFGRERDRAHAIAALDSADDIRAGIQNRVVHTLGVVTTKSSSVSTSISIHKREAPKMPSEVEAALAMVRGEWLRPDGDEIMEALDQARYARQVACGFYTYWHFFDEPTDSLIKEWYGARKNFGRDRRVKLQHAETHLDSPDLLSNAAERAWMDSDCILCEGRLGHRCRNAKNHHYKGDLPVWKADSWPAWIEIKNKIRYESRAKWIEGSNNKVEGVGDFLARDAAKWATEHRGIVWCESVAFGEKVAHLAGLPYHGGGKNAEALILSEKGDRSIIASISSHSEGRDGLQFKFREQLVAEVPSSGKAWEQLLARLARPGQQSETVDTWVYAHVPECIEALKRAILLAEFDEAMSPNRQLLLAADFTFDL